MFELLLPHDSDAILDACAVRGLRVRGQGRLPVRRASGAPRWNLGWPDRSGTIEVTESRDGVVLTVAPNRDAGWATGFARRLARTLAEDAAHAAGRVEPLRPRVLVVVHDPPIPSEGDRRLTEVMGWHDPDALVAQYVADLAEASHGNLRYDVVHRLDKPWWPPKRDGFRYTAEDYLRRWPTRDMHQPDAIDYPAQMRAFDLMKRWERDEFDECWFVTFPYAGDWESTMVGRGAFWCNSPPVDGFDTAAGRFVLMGFNYEREVGCMLENFGHRTEAMMERIWRRKNGERNLWHRFIQYDKTHPGRAHCGNVHFAPNSERDYDWGNRRPVLSQCDDWMAFPRYAAADPAAGPDAAPARARTVDCRDWGNGDMRAHHVWWLSHLPHVAGETDGVANNWWRYVADPNRVA